jgi:hypothetical protein
MLATFDAWYDVQSETRVSARACWLDGTMTAPVGFPVSLECPLPPPLEAWEIHELLNEMASGTRPCTSCCTQCSGSCCNASCLAS